MFISKRGFVAIKATVLFLLMLTLGACNTFSGMGKDISTSAEWTKGKMNGQDSSGNQASPTTKNDSNQQPTQKNQTTK